jgi:protocatechuate 3,4-dioxygenase beta subunit
MTRQIDASTMFQRVSQLSLFVLFWLAVTAVAANSQVQAESSSLTGAVVDTTDGRRPVRRAIVTITGPALKMPRSLVTDDSGAFEFDGLRPGNYFITASKPAYLRGTYGAPPPSRSALPVRLSLREHRTGLELAMARGATLAGKITDGNGQPEPGATVTVFRRLVGDAGTPVATNVSDDLGRFRVFGLEPGTYVLAVNFSPSGPTDRVEVRSDEAVQSILDVLGKGLPAPTASPVIEKDVPTYYPNAWDASDATDITVGIGETRVGLDVVLRRGHTVSVSGAIVPSVQSPSLVTLIAESGLLIKGAQVATQVVPASDGTFRFAGVNPGRYILRTDQPDGLWARELVDVVDRDLSGIRLDLRSSVSYEGRIKFEETANARTPVTAPIRITFASDSDKALRAAAARGQVRVSHPIDVSTQVRADGHFTATGLRPGRYEITASSVPGWSITSITVGTEEVRDAFVELGSMNPTDTELLITYARSGARVSGLLGPGGCPGCSVILVPTDSSTWRWSPKRIQAVSPNETGEFVFDNPVPGDYFLGVVTNLAPEDLADPVFLERLRTGAVPAHIASGEQKRLNLRIGGLADDDGCLPTDGANLLTGAEHSLLLSSLDPDLYGMFMR